MNCCEKRYKIHLELPRRILNNKKKKKSTQIIQCPDYSYFCTNITRSFQLFQRALMRGTPFHAEE